MATELLLLIEDAGQSAWLVQGRHCRLLGQVAGHDWGVQHDQWLQTGRDCAWRVYLHVQDLQYQVEDLPRLRGRDLQYLLKRKLSEWLPASALANLSRLHAVTGLRAEERYRLCVLPAAHVIQSLLQTCANRKMLLKGVHDFSLRLSLCLPAYPYVLLVNCRDDVLHLSYWHQGQLYFARHVPVTSAAMLTPALSQALTETRMYVASRRWLSEQAKLHIRCLCEDSMADRVTQALTLQTMQDRYDVAQRPAWPDWLRHLLSQSQSDTANLATAQHMQPHFQRQWLGLVVLATWLWCLSGLAWSWHAMQQVDRLRQQIHADQQQLRPARPDQANLQSVSRWAAQAQVFAQRTQQQRLPDRLWHLLASLQQPCWQLQQVRWFTGPAQGDSALTAWQEQAELHYQSTCATAQPTGAVLLAAARQADAVQAASLQAAPSTLPSQGDTAQTYAQPVTVTLALTFKPPPMHRQMP